MKIYKMIFVMFLVVSITGCVENENTIDNISELNGSNSMEIELTSILEVDSGQLNIESEFSHTNLISDKPQNFSADNVQENKKLILSDFEFNLYYKESLYYPIGSKTVHKYIVDGDDAKTILVDDKGNVNSILYGFTKLDVSKNASPKEVLEALTGELSKIISVSYYQYVRTPDATQNTDGFGIYDYLFYNKCGEYITDYMNVSVSDNGTVFGLKINHLTVVDFKLDINKAKLDNAIALKLSSIYDTDDTQYQSYSVAFDPCIIQYENRLYVQCFVTAKYLHTEKGEINSYINNILIPLSGLNN